HVSRLRLPDLTPLAPRSEPPPPTPAQAVTILLSRRRFLQARAAAAVVAAAVLPGRRAAAPPSPRRIDPAGRRRPRRRAPRGRAIHRGAAHGVRAPGPPPVRGRPRQRPGALHRLRDRQPVAPAPPELVQALRAAEPPPGPLLAVADPRDGRAVGGRSGARGAARPAAPGAAEPPARGLSR